MQYLTFACSSLPDIVISVNTVMLHIVIFVNAHDFGILHICMCKLPDIVISVNTVMLHTVIFVNTDDFVMLHIFICKLQDIDHLRQHRLCNASHLHV